MKKLRGGDTEQAILCAFLGFLGVQNIGFLKGGMGHGTLPKMYVHETAQSVTKKFTCWRFLPNTIICTLSDLKYKLFYFLPILYQLFDTKTVYFCCFFANGIYYKHLTEKLFRREAALHGSKNMPNDFFLKLKTSAHVLP